MPDITMCKETDCVKAHQCRRSPLSGTVETPHFQSWFVNDPRQDPEEPDVYCMHYWPVRED